MDQLDHFLIDRLKIGSTELTGCTASSVSLGTIDSAKNKVEELLAERLNDPDCFVCSQYTWTALKRHWKRPVCEGCGVLDWMDHLMGIPVYVASTDQLARLKARELLDAGKRVGLITFDGDPSSTSGARP
jgi:hypothetical protein